MSAFLGKMETPDQTASPPEFLSRRVLIFVALLFLAAYAAVLWTRLSWAVGGADSAGYANGARLLRDGRLVEPLRALDAFSLDVKFSRVFRPLGFTYGLNEKLLASQYPLGMSFHEYFAAMIFGWARGPYLVSPLAAIIGLILMYLLARRLGLSRLYSAAGALILALMPAYMFIALQPMTDVLATTWIMAAFLSAMLARRRAGWAVLSGAAFGIAFLVRPSDALFALPLLIALPAKPKAYLLFGAGAFPFGALWLVINRFVYGGWLVTGYRGIPGRTLALSNFPPHFLHYGAWLIVTLTPLIPLAWPMIPALRKVALKDRMMLFVWFLVVFMFYCTFQPADAWWYLRYLLPGIPALILAALLLARSVFSGARFRNGERGSARKLAAVAAALCLAIVAVNEARLIPQLNVLVIGDGENVYRQSSEWANRNWPEKSVVFSMQTSGSLAYFTKFIPCRYDLIDSGQFDVVRARAAGRGYEVFAMLFPYEEKTFLDKNLGRWTKIRNVRHVSLWKLLPD